MHDLTEYEHGMAPYQPMTVTVEVWPVAADRSGIWLLSGTDGAWPSLPVSRASDPHSAAEVELMQHGAFADLVTLHSTSWRVDGTCVVLTYVAVVDCGPIVKTDWPGAKPVSTRTAAVVGTPPTHGATEAPTVRYWDVLLHGIRHLAFLRDTDATVAAALPAAWEPHLATWEPEIARMYQELHQAV